MKDHDVSLEKARERYENAVYIGQTEPSAKSFLVLGAFVVVLVLLTGIASSFVGRLGLSSDSLQVLGWGVGVGGITLMILAVLGVTLGPTINVLWARRKLREAEAAVEGQ